MKRFYQIVHIRKKHWPTKRLHWFVGWTASPRPGPERKRAVGNLEKNRRHRPSWPGFLWCAWVRRKTRIYKLTHTDTHEYISQTCTKAFVCQTHGLVRFSHLEWKRRFRWTYITWNIKTLEKPNTEIRKAIWINFSEYERQKRKEGELEQNCRAETWTTSLSEAKGRKEKRDGENGLVGKTRARVCTSYARKPQQKAATRASDAQI